MKGENENLNPPEDPDDDRVVESEGAIPVTPPPGPIRDANGEPRRGQYESNEMVSRESPVAPYFGLYRWRPFVELFCSVADRVNPGDDVIESRNAFLQRHPLFFRASVFCDFVLQFVVVVAIILAIGFIALRAAGLEIEVARIPLPIVNA